MSAQPKLQPDDFERLKKILEDAPRDYGFLAEYVGELEHGRNEVRLVTERNAAEGLAEQAGRQVPSDSPG